MTTSNTVTTESIQAKIIDVSYHVFEGTTTTHCMITVRNGFTFTGESACVDPANFNKKLGEEIAYRNAFNKIWSHEGYLLQESLM